MLFNSVQFVVFFIVVYFVYHRLPHRAQNRMLLVASYFFYACWDWRFLGLILLSTIVDYWCGGRIAAVPSRSSKRGFLALSIVVNLGVLGFFKYFNFFAENLYVLLHAVGLPMLLPTLEIILPVGISFYTFQTMSYTIDVYRGELKPIQNHFDFALFVAFFPQLVAGPIERAKRLLPQIMAPRRVTTKHLTEGLFLFAWGLFKKVCIADTLAMIVNPIFLKDANWLAPEVLVGGYAFAFQIYCDFSGYSDIARGVAKLLGFDIIRNFNLPYVATSPQDFWRRWHISLSTWLRDYLYISLGGNRKGNARTYLNLFVTMGLGGLWHGAAWTFIIWGMYHGLLLALHRISESITKGFTALTRFFDTPSGTVVKRLVMFHIITIGWIVFRAQSPGQALGMLSSLANNWHLNAEVILACKRLIFYVLPLLLFQWIHFRRDDPVWVLAVPWKQQLIVAALLTAHVIAVLLVSLPTAKEFIYFQF